VNDTGAADVAAASAQQHPAQGLPEETLVFLLGSRYCETDLLSEVAWDLFGKSLAGWDRVQAICDFVHQHIVFGYEHARPTKTAWEQTTSQHPGSWALLILLAKSFSRRPRP
jgi:transglutaminase-like putative cysteine protease